MHSVLEEDYSGENELKMRNGREEGAGFAFWTKRSRKPYWDLRKTWRSGYHVHCSEVSSLLDNIQLRCFFKMLKVRMSSTKSFNRLGCHLASKVYCSYISNERSFLCVQWEVLPDVFSGEKRQAIGQRVAVLLCRERRNIRNTWKEIRYQSMGWWHFHGVWPLKLQKMAIRDSVGYSWWRDV